MCLKPLRRFAKLLAPALALMAPAAYAVDHINPAGLNTWDLYVYGNGAAISSILTAIKLMIAPTSGGGSFQTLLLFLATAGFLSMAVRAGFDPAKNFVRMFLYIIVIWMVVYTTKYAQSNVNVYDKYSNYSNVVTGVPALVAVPAAVISQVGEYLTLQIEQNFTLPLGADASTLNLSAGNEYNLFAKVISDSDKYVLADPDLKRSMSAFISDCVVDSIALGRMSVQQLTSSPNLVATLSAASSQSLMTRYYMSEFMAASSADKNNPGKYNGPYCAAGGLDSSQVNTTTPGLGVLMTCQQAYNCLNGDLGMYANALVAATSAQWAATGVTTPFESAMQSAIGMAGAAQGANPQAAYSSAEGFILQKAMIASSQSAFVDAAARTNNSPLMLATSIAQAEQSQKTSWWTASEIFKNMMGYVFVVLQAFVFAMVPVIVICLMIPGMGGTVLLNYIQILVWLTLWQPMLAIVNFLVEIFGSSQLSTTIGADGITMMNHAVVSEQTNNLVIVAQFMGTLVPLMTWGLVKGAMAFTEFISHGIGSSFAVQAGAQAATGNVSMGNMSLDNISMEKYSTQRTSAVGNPAVESAQGGGHVNEKGDLGGRTQFGAGQNMGVTSKRDETWSIQDSDGTVHKVSSQDSRSVAENSTWAANEARNISNSVSKMEALTDSVMHDKAVQNSMSVDESNKLDKQRNDAMTAAQDYGAAVKASIGGKIGGVVGGEADMSFARSLHAAQAKAHSTSEKLGASQSHSQGASWGTSAAFSQGTSMGRSIAESANHTAMVGDDFAKSVNAQAAASESVSQSLGRDFGGPGGLNADSTGFAPELSRSARAEGATITERVGSADTSIGHEVGDVKQDEARARAAVAAANHEVDTHTPTRLTPIKLMRVSHPCGSLSTRAAQLRVLTLLQRRRITTTSPQFNPLVQTQRRN
jgi:hypothetical protein